MSSPLISTPYSSSAIWASSTRSSESTSSASNSASRLILSGSAPNSSSALKTRCSTCSLVAVVLIAPPFGPCPLCGQAAVDCQGRSGHVRGLVRGEEAHAGRDLLGGAGAAGRGRLQQPAPQTRGDGPLPPAPRPRAGDDPL